MVSAIFLPTMGTSVVSLYSHFQASDGQPASEGLTLNGSYNLGLLQATTGSHNTIQLNDINNSWTATTETDTITPQQDSTVTSLSVCDQSLATANSSSQLAAVSVPPKTISKQIQVLSASIVKFSAAPAVKPDRVMAAEDAVLHPKALAVAVNSSHERVISIVPWASNATVASSVGPLDTSLLTTLATLRAGTLEALYFECPFKRSWQS